MSEKRELTYAEWQEIQTDFRPMVDGQPHVVSNGGERGTILEPVEVQGLGQKVEEAARALDNTFAEALRAGGGMSLQEANGDLNDASRALIAAFVQEYGSCWLGRVNLYTDEQRKRPIWMHKGGTVYNFGASFVLAEFDKELQDMILERDAAPYTGTSDDAERVDAIYERVKELGGHSLAWS